MTLPGRSNDIIVDLPEGKSITLTLIGAQIDIDRANGVVACCGTEMPLNGSRRLRVIQDVHALEIYTERGDHVMCVSHMADMCLNRIEGKGVAFTAWRV